MKEDTVSAKELTKACTPRGALNLVLLKGILYFWPY